MGPLFSWWRWQGCDGRGSAGWDGRRDPQQCHRCPPQPLRAGLTPACPAQGQLGENCPTLCEMLHFTAWPELALSEANGRGCK